MHLITHSGTPTLLRTHHSYFPCIAILLGQGQAFVFTATVFLLTNFVLIPMCWFCLAFNILYVVRPTYCLSYYCDFCLAIRYICLLLRRNNLICKCVWPPLTLTTLDTRNHKRVLKSQNFILWYFMVHLLTCVSKQDKSLRTVPLFLWNDYITLVFVSF